MNTALQSNFKRLGIVLSCAMLSVLTVAFATEARAQTATNGTLHGTVTATSTGTGGDDGQDTGTTTSALHDRIAELEDEVSMLRSELFGLKMEISLLRSLVEGADSGSGTTTEDDDMTETGENGTTTDSTATTSASITIMPQNATARAGTSIDFNGRGFWYDEPVIVTGNNGDTTVTARADSQGNFSTGSMPVRTSTGTQTFTFTGSWSGKVGTATVTVIP
jgi:hypothetical protein